jgi:hypothetical protein
MICFESHKQALNIPAVADIHAVTQSVLAVAGISAGSGFTAVAMGIFNIRLQGKLTNYSILDLAY